MAGQEKYIQALAKRINDLRVERKLSFQNMADDCDLDKMQIYNICTKGLDIKASTIVKIAKGLEMAVSELMDFKY